ncbi:MAG: hypothetical protein ACMG6E_03185 [Candidatus Roizmanbacteria bacterium]
MAKAEKKFNINQDKQSFHIIDHSKQQNAFEMHDMNKDMDEQNEVEEY